MIRIYQKYIYKRNMFLNYRWLPLDPNFMRFLWVPNIFVYNLDTFDAMFSLQKLSGLWIIEKQDIFYNQVNFLSFESIYNGSRYKYGNLHPYFNYNNQTLFT